MRTLHVVIAFGGRYEDAWESNVRAFASVEKAEELISNYERWLTEYREAADEENLPESCQTYHVNFEDEEDACRYKIMLGEYLDQVLIDMNVPEEDREWLNDQLNGSYDCDRPSYMIKELQFEDM